MMKTSASDEVIVEVPFPVTLNELYRVNYKTKRVYITRKGKEWKATAEKAIALAFHGRDIPTRFSLTCILEMPDNRKRDLDNYMKLMLDTICNALGRDDNWKVIPSMTITCDGVVPHGRCILKIRKKE